MGTNTQHTHSHKQNNNNHNNNNNNNNRSAARCRTSGVMAWASVASAREQSSADLPATKLMSNNFWTGRVAHVRCSADVDDSFTDAATPCEQPRQQAVQIALTHTSTAAASILTISLFRKSQLFAAGPAWGGGGLGQGWVGTLSREDIFPSSRAKVGKQPEIT
jgi:hypothetical protein